VVTCRRGECRLAQGNYRAEIRVGMVRRLLEEIGVDPDRALLVHCGPDDDPRARIDEAVAKVQASG